jgi:hypothetical protein
MESVIVAHATTQLGSSAQRKSHEQHNRKIQAHTRKQARTHTARTSLWRPRPDVQHDAIPVATGRRARLAPHRRAAARAGLSTVFLLRREGPCRRAAARAGLCAVFLLRREGPCRRAAARAGLSTVFLLRLLARTAALAPHRRAAARAGLSAVFLLRREVRCGRAAARAALSAGFRLLLLARTAALALDTQKPRHEVTSGA